jgi:hypothetical protein
MHLVLSSLPASAAALDAGMIRKFLQIRQIRTLDS